MDIKEIKRLVSLVEQAQISHLSIESEGSKIEIKKDLVSNNGYASTTSVVVPQQTLPAPVSEAVAPVVNEDENLVPIKAQMVGTFYEAPNPEAKPFVKVGDTIKPGQVICIIEAMKLFNEIEAEQSGTIAKICIPNSGPVEYGQPLFLIKP